MNDGELLPIASLACFAIGLLAGYVLGVGSREEKKENDQ